VVAKTIIGNRTLYSYHGRPHAVALLRDIAFTH
jgi:hypothetical protein